MVSDAARSTGHKRDDRNGLHRRQKEAQSIAMKSQQSNGRRKGCQ